MLRIAISALALSGLGTVALTAHAGDDRPVASPAAPLEAPVAEAAVPQSTVPCWGAPPIDPAATVLTALVDVGPIPAGGVPRAERRVIRPADSGNAARPQLPIYTMHPATPATTRIVPVHMGEGFSPQARRQIIQGLGEWRQVLNGFGRLQIVGEGEPAPRPWFLRAAGGAAA